MKDEFMEICEEFSNKENLKKMMAILESREFVKTVVE